jgi:hypothetical protein
MTGVRSPTAASVGLERAGDHQGNHLPNRLGFGGLGAIGQFDDGDHGGPEFTVGLGLTGNFNFIGHGIILS